MFGPCFALALWTLLAAEPPKPPDPINPDRPDVADSAYITPKGLPILETGYRQTQMHRVTLREFGDSPLLRVGLNDHFELRVSPGAYAQLNSFGATSKGTEDGGLGFKWRFHDGKDNSGFRSPSLALEGNTSVPTGGHAFRQPALQPSVDGIVDWSIDEADEFSVNVIVGLPRDGGTQFTQEVFAGSWGHQLAKGFGGFLELYEVVAPSQHGGDRTFSDLGFNYLLNNKVSLDAFFGTSIDTRARQGFFGGGVSFRF